MSYLISYPCSFLKCPGVAKNVLMQLADMASDNGYAYPSIETICMRTDWKRSAVLEALEWLEMMGAIRRNKLNGRKTTYWVTPDKFTGPRHPERDSANQSAKRTGPPNEPVRQTDGTSPPNGRDQSAKRTLTPLTPLTPINLNTPLPPEGGAPGVEKVRTAGEAPGFDAFFAGYPRQVHEAQARRAWNRLAPSAELQGEIAQAIAAWIRSPEWQREGGRFIPKPGNWLRQQRWRDQTGIAAPPPPPAAPAPPPEPPATPEQRAARVQMARELASRARARLAERLAA